MRCTSPQLAVSIPGPLSLFCLELTHDFAADTADGEETSATTSEDLETGATTTGTDNDPTESSDPPSDDDDSPDVATIVGAVVGSVVGVALIIGAFFIGYRMGKKKGGDPNAAAGKGKGFGRPSIVWTRQDDPTQTQSVPLQQEKTSTPTTMPVSTASPPVSYPGYTMMAAPQQQQMQQGYMMPQQHQQMPMQPPPQGYSPQPQQMQQGYPPQVPQEYAQTTSPPHSELGVGPEHQGFATSDAHPHSYEMYSSPATSQPPRQ